MTSLCRIVRICPLGLFVLVVSDSLSLSLSLSLPLEHTRGFQNIYGEEGKERTHFLLFSLKKKERMKISPQRVTTKCCKSFPEKRKKFYYWTAFSFQKVVFFFLQKVSFFVHEVTSCCCCKEGERRKRAQQTIQFPRKENRVLPKKNERKKTTVCVWGKGSSSSLPPSSNRIFFSWSDLSLLNQDDFLEFCWIRSGSGLNELQSFSSHFFD